MYYTYVLQSVNSPQQIYIGYSADVKTRLLAHNKGAVKHTSKYRPWRLVVCVCFVERKMATEFERYLKSHSGRAFLKKRLL